MAQDVRRRPAPRALLDGIRALPRPHVLQGGRRADAQRAEQEQLLLRGMDSQQRQVLGELQLHTVPVCWHC